MKMKFTRREILKIFGSIIYMVSFGKIALAKQKPLRKVTVDSQVTVYRSINGNPETNLNKVIELMGGIEKIISEDDVVVIKPNVQWWNHGAPNLSAVKEFVDLIMNRPGGFNGEVVVAENCHRGASPWTSIHSGWAPIFSRNSDLDKVSNYNDLSAHLKKKYGNRFTTSH